MTSLDVGGLPKYPMDIPFYYTDNFQFLTPSSQSSGIERCQVSKLVLKTNAKFQKFSLCKYLINLSI